MKKLVLVAALVVLAIPDSAYAWGRRGGRRGGSCCGGEVTMTYSAGGSCCGPQQAMNACCGQVQTVTWQQAPCPCAQPCPCAAPCPCNQQGGIQQTRYESAPPPAAMPAQPGQPAEPRKLPNPPSF